MVATTTTNTSTQLVRLAVGSYDYAICGVEVDVDVNLDLDDDDRRPQTMRKTFADSEHSAPIRCIASKEGLMASAGHDEIIRLYNISKMADLGSLMRQEASISHLEFCGDKLCSVADDGSICIWQTSGWECLRTLKGHKAALTGFSVHPSGRLALSCSKDRQMITWDMTTGKKAHSMKVKSGSWLLKWSPEGSMYTLSADLETRLFRCSGELVTVISHPSKPLVVEFMSETQLVSGAEDGHVRVWNCDGQHEHQDTPIATLPAHPSRIRGLVMVNQDTLASASSDGTVRVVALSSEKHKVLAEIKLPLRITCLALLSSKKTAKAPTSLPSKKLVVSDAYRKQKKAEMVEAKYMADLMDKEEAKQKKKAAELKREKKEKKQAEKKARKEEEAATKNSRVNSSSSSSSSSSIKKGNSNAAAAAGGSSKKRAASSFGGKGNAKPKPKARRTK